MAKKELEKTNSGIEIADPRDLRPQALPLVITLPEGASKAQVEFAKTLNAYAYKNPTKWKIKKKVLIAQLEALKGAPDPVEEVDKKITYTNKKLSV